MKTGPLDPGKLPRPLSKPLPAKKEVSEAATGLDEFTLGKVRPSAKLLEKKRTAETARREAEGLWFGGQSNEGFRRVERDAADVNLVRVDLSVFFPGSKKGDSHAERVAKQLEANTKLEEEALARLTPEQQEQYRQLAERTKNDPDARLALQLLLIEGKLTADPRSNDGKTLLETLAGLTTQELACGIDRDALICDLIQEIAVPSAINQQDKGTCTVTAIQIMLAAQQPAEYARIIAGLASPQGEVRLRNGELIRREPNTDSADGSKRSISSLLWQPAMMEYGNGNLNYDNEADKHSDGHSGLYAHEVDRVMEGILGHKVATMHTQDVGVDALFASVAGAANAGQPVPVCVRWGVDKDGKHAYHEILVTKVENGRVYYTNPWGKEESMTFEEFRDRLTFASIPEPDASLFGQIKKVLPHLDQQQFQMQLDSLIKRHREAAFRP